MTLIYGNGRRQRRRELPREKNLEIVQPVKEGEAIVDSGEELEAR